MGCGGKDAWNKKGLEYCATLLVGIFVHDEETTIMMKDVKI
jgi:hypothetical protein